MSARTSAEIEAELAAEAAAQFAAERQRRGVIAAEEQEVRLELGRRLREVRHAAGLSLSQAAAKSGGDFPAVVMSAYERGDRNVSVARLIRLCRLYGASVHEVIPAPGPAPDSRVELATSLHVAARHLADEAARMVRESMPAQGGGR